MNPLNWRRTHQVALLFGAAIGMTIGLLVGYVYGSYWSLLAVLATAGGSGPPRAVEAWLGTGSGFRWGATGALVGGAIIYTRQLLHA